VGEEITILIGALDAAVAKAMERGEPTIMYSGGLDSGVLASLATRHGRPALMTVGVEGSHDLQAAKKGAGDLGLEWTPVILTHEDIVASLRGTLAALGPLDPVTLSFMAPLQVIASRCPGGDLISGQGADELFGGYMRYLEMGSEERGKAMETDLEAVMTSGAEMDEKLASAYGCGISHPYLDKGVIEAARAFPASEMVRDGIRKWPLRRVAMKIGSPGIAGQKKKACQYGSGIMDAMKAEAKSRGIRVAGLAEALLNE